MKELFFDYVTVEEVKAAEEELAVREQRYMEDLKSNLYQTQKTMSDNRSNAQSQGQSKLVIFGQQTS